MAWDNIVKEIHAFAKKVWRKKPTNCKKIWKHCVYTNGKECLFSIHVNGSEYYILLKKVINFGNEKNHDEINFNVNYFGMFYVFEF